MLAEQEVSCPYCGESFTTMVDYSAGAQQYVEDCYVCCRPIVFYINVDIDGELSSVQLEREDGQ